MTAIDYGPLNALIGKWQGDKGTDIAPEPDGTENNPYYETIVFSAIGDVCNAESQTLAVLHYRQIVRRHSDDKVFHDETGYWHWDAERQLVMQSLTIPRGTSLIAGGNYQDQTDAQGRVAIHVEAAEDNPDWTISQAPFMRDNARTYAFSHDLFVDAEHLSYQQSIHLDIYGKTFEHSDKNSLQRC